MSTDCYQLQSTNFPAILEKIESFHGHLCPGIAYGLRVAASGLISINANIHSDLVILAHAQSCALDAIQIVTGCTIGNGRLTIQDNGQHDFIFWNKLTGSGIRLEMIKVDFQDNDSEVGAFNRHTAGDRSAEVMSILDARLKRKVAFILSAPEEDVLNKSPLSDSPF
jgi:formylmethanofuran dehydrogenase subunit E